MPYRRFLSRIQQMFGVATDAHLQSIAAGLQDGRLKAPSRPMSDLELASAIRAFQAGPVSDETLRKLSDLLDGS